MKTLVLTSISILLFTTAFGQINFKWDKVDSIASDKNEIYSLSKMFIAETWNSAQNVIQNDDKEGGSILIKGVNIQSLNFQMNNHKWTYSYTIKFLFKDNKYKIIIQDVYCKAARCQQYEWAHMPVADTYPAEKGFKKTGVNKARYLELMSSLKKDLQNIVDGYESYLRTEQIDTDW